MRILHVYSGNLYGGIEAILVALARFTVSPSLVAHEFALCFEGRLSAELARVNATVHRLGPIRASRPQTVRAGRRALASLLASRRFDRVICHAPWSQAALARVVRQSGVPIVFWAHDTMSGRHWTERWARRIPPDLVICNSEYTRRTAAALYPDVPAAVVHAPVDVGPQPLGAEERRLIRRTLSTPDDAVVIVQASRCEAWKGHLMHVQALAELRDEHRWVCWLAGGAQRPAEARYLEHVTQAVRHAGLGDRVRFAGERTDVPRLLAAADLFCQPNLEPEPFGIVFVEALAAGLPVVTASIGGATEIVDDTCGVLVAPGDAARLAAALRRLVGDAGCRARLAAAAPARARALCDPASQIRRLTEVLAAVEPVQVGA
jgi:glycosyltransferase involved in cell wall biosynthesis